MDRPSPLPRRFLQRKRLDTAGCACVRFAQHRWNSQAWVLIVALTLSARTVVAAEPETAVTPSEAQLPPLPTVSKLETLRADAAETRELDNLFSALFAVDAGEREQAARELLEVRPRLVNAALLRFASLSERGDRERLKRALGSAKERTNRNKRSPADDSAAPDDLLYLLLAQPTTKDPAYRDLVELVALVRVFARIGTIEATRGLIDVYAKFGEFMRVDVQNRLFELKDGAVAALLEARSHKAEKIATWAERQLDRLGRAVPGEAIRTENYEYLADILRAYGRTKDHDAARIVVSYTNNERYQVREAARQAVVLMGEVSLWQLREAYQDVIGKRPRRDWSWDRTARELFYEYDRLHVAAVLGLFEAGKKAADSGDRAAMRKAYDAVLSRTPLFEHGAEMAKGYFAYAEELQQSDPEQAIVALVRAQRLTTDPALRARARSLHDTVVATKRMKAGVFDSFLLQKSIDHDGTNQKAKTLLYSFDQQAVKTMTDRVRWMTSGAIALVAFLAIGLITFRRKSPTERPQLAAPSSGPIPATDGNPSPQGESAGLSRPGAQPGASNVDSTATLVSSVSTTTETESKPPQDLTDKPRDPFEGL